MPEPLLVSIVDDDEAVRTALRRQLHAAGIRVQTFATGAEFLGSLPQARPHCLLLDLHMPGLNGFDVLRRLGTGPVRIPVLVMSGKDSAGMAEKSLALGAAGYLTKPLDIEGIVAALRAVVAIASSQ